jgi:dihydrofolate synthase / folylpolyglutamate synthase
MALLRSPRSAAAIEFLLGRIDYERTLTIPYRAREFRLDRMRDFLARLGNPHLGLRIVHVAGTKGKGSTSAMIAAALTACGYKTGLYTSPHLERVEERIQVNLEPCNSEAFATLVERIRPIVEQMDAEYRAATPTEDGPTYFEITTAIALLHFADVQTEFAVLEVGLGGRLDSTNVCTPLVSVITSISYDHTQLLGNTLALIATEKAGIIKSRIPVVSGVIDNEPRQAIVEAARKQDCPLAELTADFDYNYNPAQSLDLPQSERTLAALDFECRYCNLGVRMSGVQLGLAGRHQAANAAIALMALQELAALGWNLPEADIRRGLANLSWPARIEVISQRPTVVIDAAHNVASIQSLIETLEESFVAQRRILVFATTQDKDVRGMLELLLPKVEAVVFTRYLKNPRAVPTEELENLAASISPIPRHTAPTPETAYEVAHSLSTPEHLICVTGSFYLAAEIRSTILDSAASPSEQIRPLSAAAAQL